MMLMMTMMPILSSQALSSAIPIAKRASGN